jgi:hypothetical protein
MTTLPVAGRFSDGTLTNAQAKSAQNDMLAAMREMLGGEAVTTLTIASGVITPSRAVHLVDTEGSAAADDLDRIANTNHPDGRVVIIGTVDAARDVTVRHGLATSGANLRILLAGGVDLVLSDPSMRLVLQRRGTDWVEIDRSYGNQAAAERTAIGAAASGGVTGSGLTMATARLLGRTSAGTGAIEELDAPAARTLLGSAFKDPVRVASTASVTISGPGTAIDGVTLSVGDRVLLKDQSTTSANGIYIFQGSGSSMTRAADADTWAKLPSALVAVQEGTIGADGVWLCTANAGGTLGTTGISWVRVGPGVQQVGGTITLSGLTIDVTGLPSWARRITIFVQALSLSGSAAPHVGLGTSGGIEATGYNSVVSTVGTVATVLSSTTAIPIQVSTTPASVLFGRIVLERYAANTWLATVDMVDVINVVTSRGSSAKTLSGTLDRIRFGTSTGTDSYDGTGIATIFAGP